MEVINTLAYYNNCGPKKFYRKALMSLGYVKGNHRKSQSVALENCAHIGNIEMIVTKLIDIRGCIDCSLAWSACLVLVE